MVNTTHAAGGSAELSSVAEISVWFADDDAGLLETMAQLLKPIPRLKLSRCCSSAEELIRALKSEPAPHVVLLDLQMNGMSGLEAIAPIKQFAPQTHVIIFTSYFDSGARRAALAAGASDFLLKRSSSDRIVGCIKSFFPMDGAPGKGVIAALCPPGT